MVVTRKGSGAAATPRNAGTELVISGLVRSLGVVSLGVVVPEVAVAVGARAETVPTPSDRT